MRSPQTRPLIPWLFPMLAIIGIVLMVLFAAESTPTGIVTLNVDRAQAETIAREFVQQRGGDLTDRTSTVSFGFNADAQSYLREFNPTHLNNRVEADLHFARWTVRFWRQLDPDEWRVTISPRTGRILGYSHIIRDEQPANSIALDAAQQQAMSALPIPADQLELVERSSKTQPERVDHTFTWRRTDMQDAKAQYRYSVTVQGDQIGSVNEYYWLPESWYRTNAWHAYRGWLLSTIGWSITAVLVVLTGLTWLILAQQGQLRWKWAIRLLIAAAVVGLIVLLNNIPIDLANYDNRQSLIVYFLGILKGYSSELVGVSVAIVLGGMAGEALAWRWSNGTLAMRETLTKRGIVSRPVVQALGIGFLVGLFQLGFISAFYALGGRWFGVWSPVSALYDDILSTPFPAIYAIALGLLPAVGEELLFRLGGITVLTHWTGKPKLAIVITAIVWASLHATYPQRPFYIRLLELSIIGIIFGILFVRYGVLASMAAHYTYNASLMLPVLWSGSWFMVFTGILAAGFVVLLLVPAIMRRLRNVPLEPDDVLAEPLPDILPEPVTALQTSAWRRDWWWLGGGALLALIALLLVGWRFAPALQRDATRQPMVERSREVAQQLGVDLTDLHPSVSVVADWVDLDLRYLYDQLDSTAIQSAVERGQARAWRVRWSEWGNVDVAWQADFDPRGNVLAFQRSWADDLPAATLPISDAQTLAETTVAQFINLADYELIDAGSFTLPQRTDHQFTWQTKQVFAGEAYRRVEVTVQGDQVSGFIPSLYTPPAYRRERDQTTTLESITAMLESSLISIPSFILPLVGLLGVLRRKTAVKPWLWLGIAVGVIALIQTIGRWTYGTVEQMPALIQAAAWAVEGAANQGGELALLAAGAATAFALRDQISLPDLRSRTTRREALALGWLLVPFGMLFLTLRAWLSVKPGLFASPDALNAQAAWLDVALRAIIHSTTTTLLLVGSYGLLRYALRGRPTLALWLTCAGFLLSAINLREPMQWLLAAIALVPCFWLARQLRGNIGALWWALFVIRILPSAVALMNTFPRSIQLNGAFLLVLLAGTLGWSAGAWIEEQRNSAIGDGLLGK